MKIKTITFALKKGLPNYSSVSAGMEVEVMEGENLSKVWDEIKQEVIKQCNEDAGWINDKQTNEQGVK